MTDPKMGAEAGARTSRKQDTLALRCDIVLHKPRIIAQNLRLASQATFGSTATYAHVFAYSFSAETALDLSGKRRKRSFSACSRQRGAHGTSLSLRGEGTSPRKARFCKNNLIHQ